MPEKIIIAVDAMSGSGGPLVIAQGLSNFSKKHGDVFLRIFGKKDLLSEELRRAELSVDSFTIVDCQDVVLDNDKPMHTWRNNKFSSMRKAIEDVRDKKASAVISCGNTGALMKTAKMLLKTLPHVKRPGILAVIPGISSRGTIMLDVGANIECGVEHLFHFAIMGCCFAQIVLATNDPKIGILNIGSEEIKGRTLEQKSYSILKESGLNFTGFVEANEVVKGKVDVLVTDGFSGNIFLKASEGAAEMCINVFKNTVKNAGFFSKLAAILLKSCLKKSLSVISPNRHNGAMFVGLNGIVIKSHGSANAEGVENALSVAYKLSRANINQKIECKLHEMKEKGITLNFVDKLKHKSAQILGMK
jgi:glycerol-3-phosphate acyltransferase PlsX